MIKVGPNFASIVVTGFINSSRLHLPQARRIQLPLPGVVSASCLVKYATRSTAISGKLRR